MCIRDRRRSPPPRRGQRTGSARQAVPAGAQARSAAVSYTHLGTFAPNAPITRAEFAAIAARFDDKNTDTSSKFTDILSNWAKNEIGIAANKGWINGYPDGTCLLYTSPVLHGTGVQHDVVRYHAVYHDRSHDNGVNNVLKFVFWHFVFSFLCCLLYTSRCV